MLAELWYENNEGTRWLVPEKGPIEPPEGFRYQHSQFACEVKHMVLDCSGGKSERLAEVTATYSPDLVLALTRPTFLERLRQFISYGRFEPRREFREAVLIAVTSCERCVNVIAHRVGLTWGYEKGSLSWHLSGTQCEFCVSEPPPHARIR